MKQKKVTLYWLEHSKYDLDTAKAMFDSGRYLYVTFMCQQAIEKLLKAIITIKKEETPPKIHNLSRLAEISEVLVGLNEDQINLLATLTPFCITARYADYGEKMSKLTNKKLANGYYTKTVELFKCLKKMI